MKLGNGYEIRTDPHNFILCHRRTVESGKRKGEETLKTLGYFGTLEQAIDRLITECFRDATEQAEDLQAFREELAGARRVFQTLQGGGQ